MMPHDVDFLLIGGGLASVTAAETIRLEGNKGSILILSDEQLLPYRRPSLSKRYLLGKVNETQISIRPETFYQEHAIDLQLRARVAAVDTRKQVVATENGDRYQYGKLLLAVGLRPRRLQVPGASLAGVHNLRSKNDCDAIRLSAGNAKRVVVLGGSFIGMEITMSLVSLGLQVTIVERCDGLLPHLGATCISDYFKRYAALHGVTILLNDTAVALHGEHQVQAVETANGQQLPCEMVVVAIGAMPVTGFLQGSDITLDRGLIVVDDLLRTNKPNVFAAGDVTSFYDPVFAQRRHIEHWDNAIKQGRLAAKNMLGQRVRYDEISYYFSEIGDINFNVLGKTDGTDEWIARGDLDAKSFALFYLQENLSCALFSIGRPVEETRAVERLIRYRSNLLSMKKRLADPNDALEKIATQTVLILQGGGAMGAFECGAVKALEEKEIYPDVVAGVSIGALNGAIIAGNPQHATAALEAFWADLSVVLPSLGSIEVTRNVAAMLTLTFGIHNFFTPRWMLPICQATSWPVNWISFYDMSPMKKLITQYVDFSTLKKSPVRLLISAVNVTTAKLETFDSYVDALTPEHILASGSLPPGFPWTVIDDNAYWDGGIISNSPLDLVIDRCGLENKRIFIVDLYSDRKPLPDNMMDVLARRDEIVYSERIRSDMRTQETISSYRALVEEVLSFVEPADSNKIKQRPRYIELMGSDEPISVTRFIRACRAGEVPWHDYDFSQDSIQLNRSEGYAVVKKTLARDAAMNQAAQR
jgi:NADPH-dependent 2,4-dienoyl-CoA reductase/sulfur reductase-like enzyme/predicted acylesterase/phospholipase RssA